MTRPKYFTYRDVALHNKKDDLWVILFKKVLDITPLCQEVESEGVFPLLAFGGKDIGHFFDDQGEVKFHVNPETNKIHTFAPFRAFIHIPSHERIEETCLKRRFQDENMADKLVERFSKQRFNKIDNNSNILKLPVKDTKAKDVDIPWWQDEKYVIGLLTDKSRWIKIKNMLIKKTMVLEVCSEETLDEILLRYLKFNCHARSYTWKYMGQKLMMNTTLEQNGIPDLDFKVEGLKLNADDYIPTVNLYFNDDLTEM
ncbi:cytochrome b5 domain-containing protein 1 [Trichonephila clavata]|uniref:Cytochrome b5 domain-containing protein 1 n=1 Tax=Trichonephila clavata TaxID=2740835 RepID=A0A8X6F6U8_TRICU|nr:cytochrome b5 domain-containing protein 1 [Trichonephila clavata]